MKYTEVTRWNNDTTEETLSGNNAGEMKKAVEEYNKNIKKA
jgi:hypothetical protein